MATEPLAIKWQPQPLQVDEAAAKALVIKNPLPVVAKAFGFHEPSPEQAAEYGPTNAVDFWALLQHFLHAEMDRQLSLIHETASKYQERHNLEIEYLQRAMFNKTMNVIQLKAGIENALAAAIPSIPKEQTDPMDLEFTPTPVIVADLVVDLERQIKKGKKTLTPNENPEDNADRDARARRGGTAPPPTPGAALGPTETTGRQRPTTLTNTASGGSGGGAPPRKPQKSATGDNLHDSSDNSDSDPSDNEGGELPKKKSTSNQLLNKYVKAIISYQKRRDKADAPKPHPYKGDPEDLERFIRQLENVWVLDSHKYKKDITIIRYAANLLQKNGTDKHRDPVQWYEAYHPKIDLAAARRLPGGAKAILDPVWSTWSVFVESLRASFATRLGREQAVNQWQELKHTDSIDDFLDSLTNLMWRTVYSQEVATDKMVRGLNKGIGLVWAQTPQKPRSLYEQMALLRDIGHSLENFRVLNK